MDPRFPELFALLQQIIFFALLVVCAYTDVARDKVYNWATLPALVGGLALWFIPFGLSGRFYQALGGMFLGGGIFALFFLFRAVGGGDVKLMAAIGALMGLEFVLNSLLVIAVIGAVMALVVLVVRRSLRRGLKSSAKMLVTLRRKKTGGEERPLTIPYGVAITTGSVITWAFLMFSGHLATVATMARAIPR